MASSTDQVLEFLQQFARQSLPQARMELDEVRGFATQSGATFSLQAWDIRYCSEKLRQQRYRVSRQKLRPYFPVTAVVPGMFAVVERLYGIQICERAGVSRWHADMRFFDVLDVSGELHDRPRR